MLTPPPPAPPSVPSFQTDSLVIAVVLAFRLVPPHATIVAQGAGNIVAAGAGNIVAQGAEDPPAELLTGKSTPSLAARDKEVRLALDTLKARETTAKLQGGGSVAMMRAAFVP